MIVSIIVAVDRHGLIGDGSVLPWRLPRDLKRFKSLTMGKPVVMGRTTFLSIGKPLPGRPNIILTRDPTFSAPGCQVAHSLAEGLSAGRKCLAAAGGEEVMVIGGAQVYKGAIPLWDRLYLTVVEGDFRGTAYFPLDQLRRQGGKIIGEETWPADEKNTHPHSFYLIERDRGTDRLAPQAGGLGPAMLSATEPALDVPAIFPRMPQSS
jgi:dihydrofolate reductase